MKYLLGAILVAAIVTAGVFAVAAVAIVAVLVLAARWIRQRLRPGGTVKRPDPRGTEVIDVATTEVHEDDPSPDRPARLE